jgi:hypothetical protein
VTFKGGILAAWLSAKIKIKKLYNIFVVQFFLVLDEIVSTEMKLT